MVLHRAILGSLERFMAVLIEHTGGAFPLWLAPLQAQVLPITDKHHAFAQEVAKNLRGRGFRIAVDDRSEKVGFKIREAQLRKVPFMLVVGDKEIESGNVAVRNRKNGDLGPSSVEDLASTLGRLVRERSLAE